MRKGSACRFVASSGVRADGVAKPRSNDKNGRRHSALYWRFFVNVALMLIDAAVFLMVGAAILNLLGGSIDNSEHMGMVNGTVLILISSVMWVLCLRVAGVYHRHVMGDGYQLNTLMFEGAVICWLMMCAVCFIVKLNIPLSTVTLIVTFAWIATMIVRAFVRVFIIRSREKGKYAYATVIVGSLKGIGETLQFLSNHSQLNYRAVAVCPIELNANGEVVSCNDTEELDHIVARHWGHPLPVVTYNHDFDEGIATVQAQTVMVCDVLRRDSDVFNTFSLRVESLGLELALITSALDVGGHMLSMRVIEGVNVLTISLPQYSVVGRLVKRIFDIVVSLIAIVVSSPIMLAVAIAIKCDDGGPVLYRQERIGLRGKPFKIFKFRSMGINADKHDAEVAAASGQTLGARFKVKDDPRVTRVGKFIRKTSLDELPQFFNSLIGNMSVVGPRPQRQYEVDAYSSVYATRLLIKPGITGPWQVSGRNDLSEEESQQLDVTYVQNWSILGDIVYILRTIGVVLHPKGAY